MAPHVFSANAAAHLSLRAPEFRSGFADKRPGHATFVGVALIVYARHQERPLALLARPFLQGGDRPPPAAPMGKLFIPPPRPRGFPPLPRFGAVRASPLLPSRP